jgi:hypothetical protein
MGVLNEKRCNKILPEINTWQSAELDGQSNAQPQTKLVDDPINSDNDALILAISSIYYLFYIIIQ